MRFKEFLKKIGSFICTKEIFEDRVLSVRLYKYFLTGILIRLLFLPFFFQRDILSTYQRAAETVFAGNFRVNFEQIITHVIHSLNLFIIKPLIPALDKVSSILLNQDTWVSWIEFNSMDQVYRVLTLFKLPYLALDIVCMFMIIRLVYDRDPQMRLKVFKYWVLNPLVIFVLYVFARHDIIAITVTIAALLLAKYGKKYWAIILLAAGIAIRFFPIMILPFAIVFLAKKRRDYVILFSIGIAGLLAIEVFSYLYFGRSVIFTLLNAQHFDYILSAKLDLIIHDRIYLFIVAYALLLFSFMHRREKSFTVFLNYCAMTYILYVATSYFHPQYLLWSIPFLVIIFARKNSLYYYHLVQTVLLMFILIYWGDLVTKFLIAPVDIRFALYSLGPIPLIERVYDSAKFVNIFRSVFTAVSLWMIYLIYKDSANAKPLNSAGQAAAYIDEKQKQKNSQ
ncbi:MAG: hypothetical protein JW997_06970 [Actinobacteria bacterium]|nr:hypothetical protein [Actinomycetota bacterium]